MTLTPYQHRSAQGRAGEALGRFDPAHTSVGNQSQFRRDPASVGRPCSLLPLTPPLTWPGDLARGPGLFHSIARRALTAEHVRGCSSKGSRRRLAKSSRLVGRRNCRGYSARTLSLDVAHHVCQDKSDTPHRHVVNAFHGVTFQHGNSDTIERPKSWKLQPARTAP